MRVVCQLHATGPRFPGLDIHLYSGWMYSDVPVFQLQRAAFISAVAPFYATVYQYCACWSADSSGQWDLNRLCPEAKLVDVVYSLPGGVA